MTASPAPRPHRPQQKNTPRRPKEGGRGAAAQRWRTYGGDCLPKVCPVGTVLASGTLAHSAIPAPKKGPAGTVSGSSDYFLSKLWQSVHSSMEGWGSWVPTWILSKEQ